MIRADRLFWSALIGLFLSGFGCETQKANPVGNHLVGRDPGKVIALAPIPLSSGESFLELVAPIVLGEREELLVGQMNGLVFRSLLRFTLPLDSLAQVTGGGKAADLVVDSVRIQVGLHSERMGSQAQLAVLEPQAKWSELDTFVDTLRMEERDMPATPIPGGGVAMQDTGVSVFLPVEYVERARAVNASAPTLEVMLGPEGGGEFLLELISRQASASHTFDRYPRMVVHFRVGAEQAVFHARSVADTYWGMRAPGPGRDQMILSKGIFYSALLTFSPPSTIPRGATINSAKLELDIDLDRSYYSSLPIEIHHVELTGAPQDTFFTRYNTRLDLDLGRAVIPFNQALVQAWVSGAQVNHGMALRPLGFPQDLTWLVLRDARLNLVFSLPPDI